MNTTIRTLTAAFALACTMLFTSAATAAPAPASVITGETDDVARFDAAVELEGQVNINTASAAELELLPGIGPSIAQRIVDYRAEHPFKETNHLMRVKGVGKKTYLKVKPYLAVEGENTLRVAGN